MSDTYLRYASVRSVFLYRLAAILKQAGIQTNTACMPFFSNPFRFFRHACIKKRNRPFRSAANHPSPWTEPSAQERCIICRNSCNVEKRRVIHNVHRIIHILRWILPVLPSLSVDNHAKCCRYKDFGSIPRIMRLGHSCKETGLLLQAIPASRLADVLFLCVGRGILFQISARSDPRSGRKGSLCCTDRGIFL